jgi:hypothetical protein
MGDLNSKIHLAGVGARGARSNVERATQAAHEFRDEARNLTTHADRLKPEDARGLRLQAADRTRQAEKAERTVKNETDRAERLEREGAELERALPAQQAKFAPLRQAGDQLETKAAALEEAASALRSAERARPAERLRLQQQADQSIARAEAAPVVDLSPLGPQIFIQAGIPLTEVPGMELMDPATSELTGPHASLDDIDPVSGLATSPPVDNPVDPFAAEDVDLVGADPVDPIAAQDVDRIVDDPVDYPLPEPAMAEMGAAPQLALADLGSPAPDPLADFPLADEPTDDTDAFQSAAPSDEYEI